VQLAQEALVVGARVVVEAGTAITEQDDERHRVLWEEIQGKHARLQSRLGVVVWVVWLGARADTLLRGLAQLELVACELRVEQSERPLYSPGREVDALSQHTQRRDRAFAELVACPLGKHRQEDLWPELVQLPRRVALDRKRLAHAQKQLLHPVHKRTEHDDNSQQELPVPNSLDHELVGRGGSRHALVRRAQRRAHVDRERDAVLCRHHCQLRRGQVRRRPSPCLEELHAARLDSWDRVCKQPRN